MLLPSVLAVLFATAVASLDPNPEYPLSAGDNGRFFTLSDGSPFFWSADTAWLLSLRLNQSEVEMYLDDRAAKGFNMVLTVGFTQIGPDAPNRNGDLPLIDHDITKPNEAYWAYVDQIVDIAWSKGLRVAFVPAWGYYVHVTDNTPGSAGISINNTNAYAFGQWFGQRYPDTPYVLVADTNPVWTNQTLFLNSYQDGGVQPEFEYTDYRTVYDLLAKGLQDGSGKGNKALITMHPTNQWFPDTPTALASSFFNDREWLTFDVSQSGHSDVPPRPPKNWWNARRGFEPVQLMYANQPARPALDNEAHYEERFDNGKNGTPVWNASDVRVGTFQGVFSGAAGFTYGANMVMQSYIPSLFDPDGSGPATPWYEQLHYPGSAQVVTSRKNWPYLVPDNSFIHSPLGHNENQTLGLRSVDNTGLLVFSPNAPSLEIDTSCLSGDFESLWFDPIDASYTQTAGDCVASMCTFTVPQNETHQDWVLVLGE